MARTAPTSELLTAAQAVEAELERFEDASAAFQKIALNSQKNLEKATKALNALADGEQRVLEQVQGLLKAINTVRERQEAHVEPIRAKAEEIKARALTFQSLERELHSLGEDASSVSARLKEAPGVSPPVELDAALAELAGKAKALAERAKGDDFDDLARLADGLRQQILAVHAKLKRLIDSAPSA
jgi:uncharacterized phage infection (PIP) family protein YhgE